MFSLFTKKLDIFGRYRYIRKSTPKTNHQQDTEYYLKILQITQECNLTIYSDNMDEMQRSEVELYIKTNNNKLF
jgi:hypothetical protein